MKAKSVSLKKSLILCLFFLLWVLLANTTIGILTQPIDPHLNSINCCFTAGISPINAGSHAVIISGGCAKDLHTGSLHIQNNPINMQACERGVFYHLPAMYPNYLVNVQMI